MMHADRSTKQPRRAREGRLSSSRHRSISSLPSTVAVRLLPIALAVAIAGCSDQPVDAPGSTPASPTFTTDHFDYFVHEGAEGPCEGIAEWLERYYDAYADFFGVDLPPGQKIEYHLFASTDDLAKELGCAPNTACARGTKVGSTTPLHAHELAHAMRSLHGDPPALFDEGLAEVLGCGDAADVSSDGLDASYPLEELVETTAFMAWCQEHGFGVYGASKSFVRFLLDRHGAQRFLAFYAEAPRKGTRAEVDAIFQASFDTSLDEAFAEWRTRPAGYHDDYCLRLAECAPSMPELVSGEIRLGCGTNGISRFNREALLRVHVPEGKTLHLATRPAYSDPAVSSVYDFHRCTGGQAFGAKEHTAWYIGVDGVLKFDPAQLWNASAIDVPPGDYVAWFSSLSEAELSLELTERGSPMRAAGCAVAEEPLALGHDFQTTLASRWVDRPCEGPWCPGKQWDVKIGSTGGALEAQAAVILNTEGEFSPQQLYVCSEPCPDDWNTCELLDLDTKSGTRVQTKQSFAPGTVLHLGAPNAPDPEHFTLRLRVAPE
jgi:hypothetical protein